MLFVAGLWKDYGNANLRRGNILWKLRKALLSLGLPNLLPGIKLFPVFESAIVVVTHKIPHLHFSGADPGDVISFDDYIFQEGAGRAGTTQSSLQGL